MPGDRESERETLDSLPELAKEGQITTEPETGAPPFSDGSGQGEAKDKLMRDREKSDVRNELHPFVQTLNINDVDSCEALENATFPPHEACTRDKFIYRLTLCGELCLGVFTSGGPGSPVRRLSTAEVAHPAESGSERKEILLGHIVSTKTTNQIVKDEDMALPPHWKDDPHRDPHLGHKEDGRTIALHSLAVLPEFQGQGLGRTLLKSYIQRMEASGIADRIALLAHADLVPFYKSVGFQDVGKSKATYAGGGWSDMVIELKDDTGSP